MVNIQNIFPDWGDIQFLPSFELHFLPSLQKYTSILPRMRKNLNCMKLWFPIRKKCSEFSMPVQAYEFGKKQSIQNNQFDQMKF